MDNSYRPYIAELIGTFAVVFLGGGAMCAAFLPFGATLSDAALVLSIALAQGLVLAVALSATINVSGGYLNPAVTLTLWVLRRLTGRQALYLIGAQLLGSLVAGMALRMIFGDNLVFAVPHLMEPLRAGAEPAAPAAMATGGGVELLLTFLLTFVIFGAVIDRRTPKLSGLGVGLIVGLALVALSLTGFRLTAASVNPARAFGPFVWWWTVETRSPDVKEHIFVYWIAPIVGALAAGWVYSYLILPADQRPTPGHPEARAVPSGKPAGPTKPAKK
jgi:aquaporin TIP